MTPLAIVLTDRGLVQSIVEEWRRVDEDREKETRKLPPVFSITLIPSKQETESA